MHPGVIGGKVIQRARPVAGLLLFNDHGDEAGGMTVTGREQNGSRSASAGIMFHQLGQDQTIGVRLLGKQRTPRGSVQGLGSPGHAAQRRRRQAECRERHPEPRRARGCDRPDPASAPKAAQRVFVGKTGDRVASVVLADDLGRNRLALKVDPDGTASIEFFDADGKVVQKIAPDAAKRCAPIPARLLGARLGQFSAQLRAAHLWQRRRDLDEASGVRRHPQRHRPWLAFS
jgi:hypothetical protein